MDALRQIWSFLGEHHGEVGAIIAVATFVTGGVPVARWLQNYSRFKHLDWQTVQPLFVETFDFAADHWMVGDYDDWRHEIAGGEYVWEGGGELTEISFVDLRISIPNDSRLFGVSKRSIDLSKKVVAVDVRFDHVPRACKAGILYRFNESPRRYYLYMLDAANSLAFYRFSSGSMSSLFSHALPSIDTTQYNKLGIVGFGSRFFLYINGDLIKIIDDKAIRSGRVGLVAVGGGRIAFDNFIVHR